MVINRSIVGEEYPAAVFRVLFEPSDTLFVLGLSDKCGIALVTAVSPSVVKRPLQNGE